MVMGGIASGLVRGMQAQARAKENKENRDLQKKLISLQLQQGQIKNKQTQMKMTILNELLKRMNLPGISQGADQTAQDQTAQDQAQGPQVPQTAFADSFKTETEGGDQAQPGVADMIAGARTQQAIGPIGAMDPAGLQFLPNVQGPAGQGGPSKLQRLPDSGPTGAMGPSGLQPLPDRGQAGVPDIMAQAIVGDMLGLPLLDVARMNETMRSNRARLNETMRHNRVLERRQIPMEYTDESGAKYRVMVPAYPGAAPAPGSPGDRAQQIDTMNQHQQQPQPSGRQGVMVAPAPVESFTYEQDGKTFQVIRNKRTGKNISKPVQVKGLKGESSETAGKIALAKQAIGYVEQLKAAFINPDGSINRALIASANANIGPGRLERAKFKDALDARQRASSGAAIGKEEEKNYIAMYFPNAAFDSDATIRNKFERLGGFMTDYLEIMDPEGIYRKKYNFYDKDDQGEPGAKAVSLPKQVIGKLKEGVATKFANGQVWTLEGGTPKRLDQ